MKAAKAFLRTKFVEFQLKIAGLNHALAEQESRFSENQTRLYLELLDILDAFEVVEETIAAKEDTLDKSARMLGKNFLSIHKKLSRLMQSCGISRMTFPDGKARMELCKVTETQPREDLEDETILSIIKNGYIDHETGSVLRKAEVITVSNEK